jgi:hypothetical protein
MRALIGQIVKVRLWLALASAVLLVALAAGPSLPVASYVLALVGAAVVVGALVAVIAIAGLRARRRQP